MNPSPLTFACPHFATSQEQQRDPTYWACNALPGQPCTWARRYDSEADPAFHSERLEQLLDTPGTPGDAVLSPEAILETGLV